MRGTRLAVGVGAALLVAVGVWYALRPPLPSGNADRAASAASPASSPETPGTASPPGAPLPKADAALSTTLPLLESRSKAGDTAASCRIALDALACLEFAESSETIGDMESMAARRQDDIAGDLDFISRLEARRTRAQALCRGIDPAWSRQNAWRYMLRAAQQGDMRMAVRFATDPPMDRQRFLEDPEGWRAYAEHARRLLEAAADSGEISGWYFLQHAYAGRPVLIGMPDAIPADPEKAAYYAMVLRPFSDAETVRDLDGQLRDLKPRFDAVRWGEIERRAQTRIAQGFPAVAGPVDFDSGVFATQDSDGCVQ